MMACDLPIPTEVNTGYTSKLDEAANCHIQLKNTNGVSNMSGLNHFDIHHRDTPPAGSIPYSRPGPALPKLSTMSEGTEEDYVDEVYDNELSAEAQAHNISMFLSSSSEDGEEPISETVITDVYKDPLEFCMEGIEEMARRILRTGKLAITGEPGDMGKLQPALFNLQPSEKEMAQIVPQLMQVAFFCQGQEQLNLMDDWDLDEPFLTVRNTEEILANGNIRLAIPVDTAIYSLLRSHCAKGARQAEELINTAMNNTVNPPTTSLISLTTMPPIFKFQSNRHHSNQRPPPTMNNGGSGGGALQPGKKHVSSSSISAESSLSMGTTASFSSLPRSETSGSNIASRKSSDDLVTSSTASFQTPVASTQSFQGPSQTPPPTSESPLPEYPARKIESIGEEPELPSTPKLHPGLGRTISNPRSRKTSTVIQPPSALRPRGDSTGSDVSLSESRYVPSSHLWNTSIFDNNTIVAQYGNSPYELVWWDPAFKIDFRLGSSVGLLSGTVTGVDPLKPEVTLKVFNNSPKQVGFSIRSHRQSTVFSSHVVYPTKGLRILEPYKSWEDNVEFHSNNPANVEMFVIDLFFCTLDAKPAWNMVRKYAIMKPLKSPNALRRASKRRFSHLQLPGTKDLKSVNLEVVLSHGLQCVVKGKLEEAEIIFSQALYLPDFQRVPLKAFVYICLAVTANKKLKQLGHAGGLAPVIRAVESSSKLVIICEQGPGSVKMPYTIQLVKQLKKELNIEKVMKDFGNKKRVGNRRNQKIEDQATAEEFKDVPLEGKELVFRDTKVTIPPNALLQPTTISLSLADSKHLIPMLKASGWNKVVQVATAIHIETNPPLDNFNKPIQIVTKLPKDMKLGSNSIVRLMHSNYLRHWEDITDDVLSKISVEGEDVHIETNLAGWLAISMIKFDASMIAQMVLKSITIEPIMLRFSAFGFVDSERKSIQLAVFVVPCKGNEDPIHKEIEKPVHFVPISFPHVVEAYPNERLQLALSGTFEADTSLGEERLVFEIDVQTKHNDIHTKWVRSTADPDTPLSGKMRVSSCRNNKGLWEALTDVSLSMRSTVSTNSSESDHRADTE